MSRIEQHIVTAWAKRLAAEVVRSVIGELQTMEAMLSGDSGLANVWEEVCAQVQGEESCEWAAYEDVVDDLLHACIRSLDRDAQLALWAVTNEGWDYIYDHHADQDGVEGLPLDTGDIVTNLASDVLSKAADYESPSLYRYKWAADDPEYDEDEDEDEDEQEEDEEDQAEDEGECEALEEPPLFAGSGKLSSGLTFDEEIYAKAKPLFISVLASMRVGSSDLREAMRLVINGVVERCGAEAAERMRPYVVRFAEDVRDDNVRLGSSSDQCDEVNSNDTGRNDTTNAESREEEIFNEGEQAGQRLRGERSAGVRPPDDRGNELLDNDEAGPEPVILGLHREQIEAFDIESSLSFLRTLVPSNDPAFAWSYKSRVSLVIGGYDDDPRELFEIPEVCRYLHGIDQEWSFWFFFLSPSDGSIKLAGMCLASAVSVSPGKVYIPPENLYRFMERGFGAVNLLFDHYGFPESDNEALTEVVSQIFAT